MLVHELGRCPGGATGTELGREGARKGKKGRTNQAQPANRKAKPYRPKTGQSTKVIIQDSCLPTEHVTGQVVVGLTDPSGVLHVHRHLHEIPYSSLLGPDVLAVQSVVPLAVAERERERDMREREREKERGERQRQRQIKHIYIDTCT